MASGVAHVLVAEALTVLEADPALAARLRNLLSGKPQAENTDRLRLAECGVPVRTLRSAIRDGELVACKVGRDLIVIRGDLHAWIETKRVKPAPRTLRGEDSPAARAIARAHHRGALRAVGGR